MHVSPPCLFVHSPQVEFFQVRAVFPRSLIDQSAVFHHDDPVGNMFDIGDNMGGEQDNAFFPKFLYHIAEPRPFLGIQARGGFIQDEEPGRLRSAWAIPSRCFIPPE